MDSVVLLVACRCLGRYRVVESKIDIYNQPEMEYMKL